METAETIEPAPSTTAPTPITLPFSTNTNTFTQVAPAPVVDGDGVFSKDDVARAVENARKQEKDKLYGRLNEMSERLKAFEDERTAQAEAEAERQAALAEAARKKAEEEMELRDLLAKKEQDWSTQYEELRNEIRTREAALEKERQYSNFVAYRERAVADASEDILPELLDLVSGNTTEEIDASIARLRERSASILENTSNALDTVRREQPGTRVTAPVAGPLENETGQRMFTPEQIAGMSMDEYAKYRDSLGVTGHAYDRGVFG